VRDIENMSPTKADAVDAMDGFKQHKDLDDDAQSPVKISVKDLLLGQTPENVHTQSYLQDVYSSIPSSGLKASDNVRHKSSTFG